MAVRRYKLKAVIENRVLTQLPAIALKGFIAAEGNTASKVESWFNDHYGFRSLLIRSKNLIDFSVFNTADRVLIGPHGWLFDKPLVETVSVALLRKPRKELERFAGRLLEVDRFLNNRGIDFIILPIPLKHTIYPEFLPETSVTFPDTSTVQLLSEILESKPELTVLNAYEILKRTKQASTVTLFPKTDFHWNNVSTYLTATAL